MITIALANQKGGVGKTTSTLALGSLLAQSGRRVLLVDMDPQSSLTQWLGINPASSLADVIGGAESGTLAMPAIIRQLSPGMDLAPSDLTLSACELGLVQRWGRENVLKAALSKVPDYDVCLVDCPPSLGLLTVAALTAAAGVLVPTLPAAADLRGLRLFLGTLEKLKAAGLNPGLQLVGIIVCQYDKRLNSHKQALEAIQAAGLPVILPPVPRSVRAQEAAGAKQPLTAYDPSGRGTGAYQEITGDIIKWLSQNPI